jgi:4-hydroxybenzoate polyprenyltransferase
VALACAYPFMKRFSNLPQILLGAAFAWSIPMAFAAETRALPMELWVVFTAVMLWTVCYDTFYAMVDRDDDLRAGVKSTAILFGDMDRVMTAGLQVLTLITLMLVGKRFELNWFFYASLVVVAVLFGYQQYLIKDRSRAGCFAAFLNNNWVGMVIFIGIVGHYAISARLS